MFKVLVIAYYFPPLGLSGVQRTLKFVKYLKNYNWEPTVLTTDEIGYYAHDFSQLDEISKAGVRIVRTKGKGINSFLAKKGTIKIPPEAIRKILSILSSTFFIPDNKKSWCKEAKTTARELLKNENYDLIFVTGPPFSTFVLAAELKKEFNLPLAVDYRDLWFGNQFGYYPTPFHKYLHKKMEYSVLKTADKIITTNRKVKEKLIDTYKFLTFEDIFIISHGFDPADFNGIVADRKTNSKMKLAYSGVFYQFITPKYFLKAFKKLSIERPDVTENIELHFIGFLRDKNRNLIRKLGIQEFVKEHGYLDHKDAVAKIISSDVLWLMVGYARNIETHSAGKLYEYFGSRKPIMACIPDGALKNSLLEYKASYITSPDNIDEIKEMILKIYEAYLSGTLPVPDEEFIDKHRRDFLTEQLSKQFQFLVKTEE